MHQVTTPLSNTGTITETNRITADPLLVDPALGDFRLQAGSPAIDAGSTNPDVTDDYVGTSRPQGAGYDLGAYERIAALALKERTPLRGVLRGVSHLGG